MQAASWHLQGPQQVVLNFLAAQSLKYMELGMRHCGIVGVTTIPATALKHGLIIEKLPYLAQLSLKSLRPCQVSNVVARLVDPPRPKRLA